MASTSGSLTETGSVTLTKPVKDTFALVQISGTYGTVTFVIEGSIDGTNYFAVAAWRYDTNALVTGTIAPSDNAEQVWKVPCEGLKFLRARVTAISSGAADFYIQSGAYVGLTPTTTINSMTFGATTVSDLTVTGEPAFTEIASVTATGSTQGDAAALSSHVSIVGAADGTKGVVLPAAAAGLERLVYNTHASNGLKIWPASGDDINDGTQDAAVTIEGKSLAIFKALDSTTWAAIYTANT